MRHRRFVGKRAIFVVLAIIALMSPVRGAYAGYWGESISAAFLDSILEKIARQIEGVFLTTLKSAAMNMMQKQVMMLVGGTSAGTSQVITNWNSYLFTEPATRAKADKEKLMNSILGGRQTSQYQMLAEQEAGIGGGYYEMLYDQVRDFDDVDIRADAAEVIGRDPVTALDEGSLPALNALMSKPTNNPYGLQLYVTSYQSDLTTRYEQEALAKATSHGFRGVEQNGMTVLPGNVVGQIVASTQKMGQDIIAAAENPAELLSGVILSATNQFLSQIMQQGLGNLQADILREMQGVTGKVNTQLTTLNAISGPSSVYSREVINQSSVYVKPATNASTAVPTLISI